MYSPDQIKHILKRELEYSHKRETSQKKAIY